MNTELVTEDEVRLRGTVSELVAAAKQVIIMTRVDMSQAVDLVAAIKKRQREAEDARTRITKPINEALREVNGRFKSMVAPLDEAESVLKGKMLTFQKAEEAKAREEAQRLQKQQDEADRLAREEAQRKRDEEAKQATDDETFDRAELPPAVVNAPLPVPERTIIEPAIRKTTFGQSGAAFTAKEVWKFELVDLAQVPVEFTLLDSSKVNQAIRAGIREIPGIRVFKESVASVK